MIRENISYQNLHNPLCEYLSYVNEVKECLLKAWEANEELVKYFRNNNDKLANRLSFIYDALEQADKILNEEFCLD